MWRLVRPSKTVCATITKHPHSLYLSSTLAHSTTSDVTQMASDQEYGQQLLSEVEKSSLGAILAQHWNAQRPPGLDTLYKILPQVQKHLNTTEESSTKPKLPFLELTGPSCSGKTQLLYYIIAISILPKRFQNLALPGLECCFVFIDTAAGSSGFQVKRLASIIKHVVTSAAVLNDDADAAAVPHEMELDMHDLPPRHKELSSSRLAEEDLNRLVQSSLRHLLIYKVASQAAVFSTLDSLEGTLLGESAYLKHAQSRPLAGIAIDSVSSFYWQIRASSSTLVKASVALEEIRAAAADGLQQSDNILTRLTAKLATLTKTFSCFVVLTSWITASLQFKTTTAGTRWPVVPQFQHRFPGLRIVLVQSDYGDIHFPQGISAEEAWEAYLGKKGMSAESGPSTSAVWRKSAAYIDGSSSKFTLWIGDGIVPQ